MILFHFRTILLSVVSLLNEPNTFSPANVDASVMFRRWKDSKGKDKEYENIIRYNQPSTYNIFVPTKKNCTERGSENCRSSRGLRSRMAFPGNQKFLGKVLFLVPSHSCHLGLATFRIVSGWEPLGNSRAFPKRTLKMLILGTLQDFPYRYLLVCYETIMFGQVTHTLDAAAMQMRSLSYLIHIL